MQWARLLYKFSLDLSSITLQSVQSYLFQFKSMF
jgi:hypothetical protein